MKIKYFLVLILIVALFVGTQDVFAGGRKMGTAGAVELLIPMGARNVGMGGANVANIRGVESMYWNPAGMALLPNTETNFSYMKYFADMNVSYFAVGSKVGQLGVLGFSLQALDIGDIPVTTLENPEGTGEVVKPNFLTIATTFSKAFTDRINFGMNAKLISEKIGNMSATAIAFDFGLQYLSPIGIDFGVVMRNYGSKIRFDGTGVEFDSPIPYANPNATTRKTKLDMASHELPASMVMGIAYRYNFAEEHTLNATGVYNNNNFTLDQINTGLEYGYKDMFFLRTGYTTPLYPSDYPENAKDYQFGLTFGFGMHFMVGGSTIMFDYAYRDMDIFDANQYFSLGFSF